MDETHVERRLAAILVADIAGYSRLMAEDEAATVDVPQGTSGRRPAHGRSPRRAHPGHGR